MNPPNNIQEFVALKVIEHLEKEDEEKKKTEQFLLSLRDFTKKNFFSLKIGKCEVCNKHLYYYTIKDNSGCFSCDGCPNLFCKECVESGKIEYRFVEYDVDYYNKNCKIHTFYKSL